MNYNYDREQNRLEVYEGDLLLVEIPYCDQMTEQDAEKLAVELFTQYKELNAE